MPVRFFPRVELRGLRPALGWLGVMAVATAGGALHAAAAEPAYPNKPIRMIQGFTIGGITDTLGRIVGEKLGERLGQNVVIEARPGAGGVVAMEAGVTATPDGYTLLVGTATITISPHFKRKLAFDPLTSLAPVAMLGTSATIFLANAATPVDSIAGLIAYARTRPGALNVATSGVGSTTDLALHLLNYMADVKLVGVPYKGSAATLTATLGGEVPLASVPLLPSIPHVQGGRLKALGVTTAKRTPALPEVPAVAETLPGFEALSWYGIFAPVKAPATIVRRLNVEINAVLAQPEIVKRLAGQGVEVDAMSIGRFREFLARDTARWKELVEKAGLELY